MFAANVVRSVVAPALRSQSVYARYASAAASAATPAEFANKPTAAEVTTLNNGVKVITASNPGNGFLSSVNAIVSVGTRHEGRQHAGIVNFLKHYGFKSTCERPQLQFSRDVEISGSTYEVQSAREHITYHSTTIPSQVGLMVKAISEQLRFPRNYYHEVERLKPVVQFEREYLQSDPVVTLVELLHTEAYRNKGLGAPLISPSYAIDQVNEERIAKFQDEFYVTKRVAFVATGVAHDSFVKAVQEVYADEPAKDSAATVPSKYVGGEVRVARDGNTHAAVALEGVSLSASTKDQLAQAVLQSVLGGGYPTRAQYPGDGVTSRLNVGAAGKEWLEGASALNASYTDSALFGVYGEAQPGHAQSLVEYLTSTLKGVLASPLSAEELSAAKNRVKSNILFSGDSVVQRADFLARQALAGGAVHTPEELAAVVDSVSAEDVTRVAKKLLSSRPTLVVVGDVENALSLEEVQAGLH